MPLISCPLCSAAVDVPASRAGSEIDCPSCKQTIPIPKLGELRKLQIEDTASANRPTVQSDTLARSSGAGQRVAFGMLMAVAALATVGASYCMVRYFAIHVPATTEDHLAEVDELYPQMSAAQLVDEWKEMEDFSEQLARPYMYQVIAEEKSNWLVNALIGFAVAAITATIAMISLAVGREKT